MNQILLNVLFLLVFVLITQHILEMYTKRLTKKTIAMYTFFSGLLTIFLCMTFPFHVNVGFNIDIRIVPFVIASLYGGPLTSIGLYVFIVLYRLYIGIDPSLYGVAINYALIPIFVYFFHKRFIKWGMKKKLLLTSGFIVTHIILSYIIYTQIIVSNTPPTIFLLGAVIKLASIALIIISIERILQNYEMRQRLLDMEKMEIISHLSASISHEIRNGLTGAKGFMQLLKESEDDTQKRKYIEIALEELGRSEGIIRDYLTFAKPAPEKVEIINMETLLNNTIEIIKPLANMNSIEVQKNLLPVSMEGERRLIQQAFLNIIKNAIEAMPNGGQLIVNMQTKARMYEVTIEDTGIGMTSEQVDRLGKPYFTTKGQKGTGLGMMVAFRVIEEFNGSISIKSIVGKGTTFTISLPRPLEVSSERAIVDPRVS